ncbi:MAG: hypothetical protein Q7L55_02600 [Actinomycetota bacterium]|nr:hypothetical protein [Actinomycetota bacterium]
MKDRRIHSGRLVAVEGRDEHGMVVDEGKNFGSVYCVGVHFASTGEVVFYEKTRVRTISE